MTNYEETQCFSKHLTTFAGGFLVLPKPINWSYVFANMDFMRNKTIYLTIIVFVTLFIALLVYARYKDRKDLQKVSSYSSLMKKRNNPFGDDAGLVGRNTDDG